MEVASGINERSRWLVDLQLDAVELKMKGRVAVVSEHISCSARPESCAVIYLIY